jgi:hypothetical protein
MSFTPLNIGGGSSVDAVVSVTSGSSHTLTVYSTTVEWNSNSGLAKSQSVIGAGPSNTGKTITIKDSYGDAASHPITITPTSGTIDKQPTITVNTNGGSLTLRSDGVSDLMVV